ncbi:polyamine ABC transporter permease [Candidatus Mycoplasma haematobovis]|uniref:Polyamine ABC transporter permease n=1 Tax=Candidatus Mycoplasma haematobovis TaxID=432608 RepID=A0A1A9QE11_9MOLU|nr:ABC transporter permease [Candidatus Mycoplasma haematobovis]OAL10241.1 polyamine ABC transporter permease [Candidatus Mycoplasma haematobovis]
MISLAIDGQKWKQRFQSSFILLIFLFLYVPLAVFMLLSFNNAHDKKDNVVTKLQFNQFNFENYRKFFTDEEGFNGGMFNALTNSFTIAFVATPIAVFIGLLTAVNIWRHNERNKNYVFATSNFSISCPDIIQGIAFSILFYALLVPLGIDLGFFTIILAHVAFSIPYVIVFIYPKLSKISKSVLYASYDLNYGFFECLFEILVPMLLPNLAGAALLVFSISFDDFIITNLVKGSVSTITTELYNMKQGVKAWSTVFGTLMILGITGVFLVNWAIKSWRSND